MKRAALCGPFFGSFTKAGPGAGASWRRPHCGGEGRLLLSEAFISQETTLASAARPERDGLVGLDGRPVAARFEAARGAQGPRPGIFSSGSRLADSVCVLLLLLAHRGVSLRTLGVASVRAWKVASAGVLSARRRRWDQASVPGTFEVIRFGQARIGDPVGSGAAQSRPWPVGRAAFRDKPPPAAGRIGLSLWPPIPFTWPQHPVSERTRRDRPQPRDHAAKHLATPDPLEKMFRLGQRSTRAAPKPAATRPPLRTHKDPHRRGLGSEGPSLRNKRGGLNWSLQR